MSSRIVLWVVGALWLLPLSGCGSLAPVVGPAQETPTRNASLGTQEGYLQFTNMTSDHWIFVDGKPIGIGNQFSSRKLYMVPAGSHVVEIIRGDVTVLQEQVLVVAASTREIALK